MYQRQLLLVVTLFSTFFQGYSDESKSLSAKQRFNDRKSQINIALITSTPTTREIEKSMNEALQYTRNVINNSNISVKIFVLQNYTSNLELSLVQFCDKVFTENITSVVIADPLLEEGKGFNFIPWVSSQLGMSVALVQGDSYQSSHDQVNYV